MPQRHDAFGVPPNGNLRILLVEDDPEVRRATKRLLEQLGWRVAGCRDAEEALEKVVQGNYDAVVSDIHLPGCDGVELMRQLRRQGVNIPFVLVSGVADPLKPVEGIASGACCFMTKPLCPEVLAAEVHKALRSTGLE